MELKILEKIKKEKRLGLFMNREFLELNNGFVHRCYLISLDNLLVSFRFFLMWIIVVGCGLQLRKICDQTNIKMIKGISRVEGIFVKTMFGFE